ncbi:MAG: exodeoxyribonuclease V subunit alpha [Pseudomonadota bacterium]|nr:exodeoxyribonuclease V subunit alpha [Pseudomonadota bacterium]
MLSRIEAWREDGVVTDIDACFSRLIDRLGGSVPEVTLAACLASHAMDAGHVCLDLRRHAGGPVFTSGGEHPVTAPGLASWLTALGESPVVGRPGDWRPLVLDDRGRLYLHRYWKDEQVLAADLIARARAIDEPGDEARAREGLSRLFPAGPGGDTDWQKVAAVVALRNRLCVISGGPGTGKTTTVARLLALLLEQSGEETPRIALAAPTGKAAARLTESIRVAREGLDTDLATRAAIPDAAATIHRLLGVMAGRPGFRHNAGNPLAIDALVVDEASMVDLSLMTRLVEALPEGARLILLGDRDQLASVEAGSVLGDICARAGEAPWSGRQVEAIARLTGEEVGAGDDAAPGIADSVVLLRRSYRFASGGEIGSLSAAVNAGLPGAVAEVLRRDGEVRRIDHFSARDPVPAAQYVAAFQDLIAERDPARALARFDGFRVLCALRSGPAGVVAVNDAVETALRRSGRVQGQGEWYPGRPVMITRNDYVLRLYNGDIGICLPETGGSDEPMIWFRAADGDLRPVSPGRLPPHETAYAMTVHKSQGSEFDRVLLILPDSDNRLLTRELLYTAITRAKVSLEIRGRSGILDASVTRRVHRESGLTEHLWGAGESSTN